MISTLFCFVLSSIYPIIPQKQIAPVTKQDWLYVGKGVRVIRFEVNADIPANKEIIVLLHKSGYITLDEHRFSVTMADIFGTSLASYENGILERRQDYLNGFGFMAKKLEPVKLDYLAALATALDESVCQELGELVRDTLSRNSRQSPKTVIEEKPHGLTRTSEFYGNWRTLKSVTWFSHCSGVRTVCEFRLVVPKK